MIIRIINRQRLCRINSVKLRAVIAFFMEKTAGENARDWGEVTVMLADDAAIRSINRQFLDRDRVTDVISFALNPQPADGGRKTAEIVVNVERAQKLAGGKHGFKNELALYLAHGCDHLAGCNDRTIRGRSKMRRRELRWLKEAAKKNLLSDLFASVSNCSCGGSRKSRS